MNNDDIDEDKEKRTTPIGLFNYAESYWQAAVTLEKANLKSTHPDSPASFLFYHAIELYFKSFLRMHGHSVSELASRKFGHSTHRLTKRATQLGLIFDDEDMQILSLMAKTDVAMRSRYIKTGFGRWPKLEGLNRVCKSLRQSVGMAMKKNGIHVRL